MCKGCQCEHGPRCCCCKCGPSLQPAILFKVTRRSSSPHKYGSLPGWEQLGFTHDLSVAMRYQDTKPRETWIAVQRGFIDERGCLYSVDKMPVASLHAVG